MSWGEQYVRKDPVHGQRTRAIMLCDKMTLTRSERHDLAHVLVGHEGSWSTLSEEDAKRIAQALEAFVYIQVIFNDRRKQRREAAS